MDKAGRDHHDKGDDKIGPYDLPGGHADEVQHREDHQAAASHRGEAHQGTHQELEADNGGSSLPTNTLRVEGLLPPGDRLDAGLEQDETGCYYKHSAH